LETKVKVELTPRMLAEAFCDMDDEQQAEFFAHCKEISSGWEGVGGIYWQALGIVKKMPVGTPGAEFLMDLAAPYYRHTLAFCGQDN
jgi:hypothetical protein